jgi:hypothetical protein
VVPKRLNTVERVPGNEQLGAVTVLYKFEILPSRTEETVIAPIAEMKELTVTIPPYTWLDSDRRAGGAARPLTLTIFALPGGLAAPGQACGAAVDFAPHDQKLNGSILVSLPCSAPNRSRPYRLNGTDGAWAEEESADDRPPMEGAVWARLRALGTKVALEDAPTPPAAVPLPAAAGGSRDTDTIVGATVGATLGAVALATLLGAGAWRAKAWRSAGSEKGAKGRPGLDEYDVRPELPVEDEEGGDLERGYATASVSREALPAGAPEGVAASLAYHRGPDGSEPLDLGAPAPDLHVTDFAHTDLVFVPDPVTDLVFTPDRFAFADASESYLHPADGYFSVAPPPHHGPRADSDGPPAVGNYRPWSQVPVIAETTPDALWVSVGPDPAPAGLRFAPLAAGGTWGDNGAGFSLRFMGYRDDGVATVTGYPAYPPASSPAPDSGASGGDGLVRVGGDGVVTRSRAVPL